MKTREKGWRVEWSDEWTGWERQREREERVSSVLPSHTQKKKLISHLRNLALPFVQIIVPHDHDLHCDEHWFISQATSIAHSHIVSFKARVSS